ncbi:DNA oxidative demethylase AlkB [Brucella haematophila]|uniref:DNA oxidative demethylase AlkB n=1 Tax=Brucella haematophila TaxID=419474 RepID=A0ABX1DN74_9HYPH|nr:DNA oxidative demethylase AlkB [Brucella haematophila]NKC04416.1 DNA oxidative demethylase AlkB [Brucella haematophila]TMU91861.1 DNA oxidative demethylase AlkB [Brucella haematophila]
MRDLFEKLEPVEILAPGAVLLRGFALPDEDAILKSVAELSTAAPFRHMVTPGGYRMSVAMTNCGQAGWVTDKSGYRYSPEDPETGNRWPIMPDAFRNLAENAAKQAGYAAFSPDACLINRYEPGAKLSLHQDKDERDFTNPIVSVSLGLPATFQFGGLKRSDPITKYPLQHGDVVVWGGPSRLYHHGILALKDGEHDKVGRVRLNLTFRKAL